SYALGTAYSPTRRSSELRHRIQGGYAGRGAPGRLRRDLRAARRSDPAPGGDSPRRARLVAPRDRADLSWTERAAGREGQVVDLRSEEHTSELQSRENLVC